MLDQFFHYNICVRDMERSLAFYCQLGFVKQDDVLPEGEDLTPHLGLSVRKLRAVIMRLAGDQVSPMLDLVQFIDPPPVGDRVPARGVTGFHSHRCFPVGSDCSRPT
jgi:hypothetical protein